MDRIGINPLSAVRLLLVSGLFVVIWLIFGAGTAHAAEPSPVGGSPSQPQPAIGGGLLPSLAAPATSLLIPAQPQTPPVPAVLPAPAPLTDSVSSAVAPVAGLARQVTDTVLALPGSLAAPLSAPVTQLVTDAIQPVSGPVDSLTGSALSLVAPVEQTLIEPPLAGVTVPPAASLPAAARPVANPVSGTAEGAVTSDVARQPATGGPVTVPAAVFPASFPGVAARSDRGPAVIMARPGGPLQGPLPEPVPGGGDPFVLPSPVSGGAGGQGQSGAGYPGPAGQVAVADLSYRFVLPATRGGLGSLFSFVLPGTPEQDTGFSPD